MVDTPIVPVEYGDDIYCSLQSLKILRKKPLLFAASPSSPRAITYVPGILLRPIWTAVFSLYDTC